MTMLQFPDAAREIHARLREMIVAHPTLSADFPAFTKEYEDLDDDERAFLREIARDEIGFELRALVKTMAGAHAQIVRILHEDASMCLSEIHKPLDQLLASERDAARAYEIREEYITTFMRSFRGN